MMKQMQYSVVLTKDNDEFRIMTFSTLHAATVYGRQYFSTLQPGAGIVTIEGTVNGNPQRMIFDGWHF